MIGEAGAQLPGGAAPTADEATPGLGALDAVAAMLAQVGTPMKVTDLTRRILDEGLWHSEGRTPVDTVSARLAVDIAQRGPNSRFQRTDKGTFALRSWGLSEYTPNLRTGKVNHPHRQKQAAPVPAPPETPAAPPQPLTPPKGMSFANAAALVLDRFANKQPMHYRAITDKAVELGLIQTAGQTPAATMYAQILTEIDRQVRRGETPRFSKHGKGLVGLTRWQGRGLAAQIEQHNAEVRRKLLAQLHAMPPAEFEALMGKLLVAMGFDDVEVTPLHGDGGIDAFGTLVVGGVIRIRMAVQVKRWTRNVQAPEVRMVRGALGAHDRGLVITTSDFAGGARGEAALPDRAPVSLMNGTELVGLLMEYGLGVHRTSHDLFELGEAEVE